MSFLRDDPTQRGLNPDGSETLHADVGVPDVPASYQGLLDMNPYQNVNFKQSNWQRFLSSLGFRTGYDQRKEDLELQAQEWNSNVATMAFQNQYDSPAAQAARMRAAGQNPDLLGTGDVAGAASMPEDTNPPAQVQSDAQSVATFANVVMSAFSMATGFAKDLGTLRSLRLANDAKEIDNVAGYITGAQKFLFEHLPADMPVSEAEWGNHFVELSGIMDSAYRPRMSKRGYTRFANEVSSLWNSLPREEAAYKMYLSKIRNKQEAHILNASSFYDDQDEVLRDVIAPLVELNDRFIAAQSKADALGAENTAATEQALSDLGVPADQAAAQSATLKGDVQEFNMQRELRSTLSKIIHKLKERADSGKSGAGFADTMLLTLSILSMMNLQSSSTTSVGPKGTSQSSSRSIGF